MKRPRNEKDELAIELGEYTAATNSTVRETAIHFAMPKTTVHNMLQIRLPKIDMTLAEKANSVLAKNKAERHIRGGISTKNKYMEMRRSNASL